MSQGPYPGTDHEEISLAVRFQGLRISIQGPAQKALEFVRKLQPEPEAEPASSAEASRSARTSLVNFAAECPDQYLALATKLSAASSHSPVERIERAWKAGLIARAQLAGERPDCSVVDLDLPSSYFVVLQARGVSETRVLRSRREFKDLAEQPTGPFFVGHGFPSETESKVFIAAAGRAPRHGA